ncbi:MAG TPA: hypothetical protein VJC10_02410 [Patescibacteria group bacterium]|nr:hypothetical protein [Patescibacteria group bacterium]
MKNREHIHQSRLPELAMFNEAKGITSGESLDLALATTNHPIHLFTVSDNMQIADVFRAVIGKGQNDFAISSVDNPIQAASQIQDLDVIPLVIHSAADPVLFQRMFADGPNFGQLLMGHLYVPTANQESPSLFTIGVANPGLDTLSKSVVRPDKTLAELIAHRRREILGDVVSNDEFREILQSNSVRKIIAHALGPVGTNISQAMAQYINGIGVGGKTELIVHPAGIEPMQYAAMAVQQVKPGLIPIHMECAVYYQMADLFDQRSDEVVFADHHYMPLDVMQLASVKDVDELAANGVMRIATHPSPRPLVNPWIDSGRAEWLKATSNSAAAHMVLAGEADACVTTGSGLKQAQGLVSRHVFGSPIMLFTIATPLNQQQLQNYR